MANHEQEQKDREFRNQMNGITQKRVEQIGVQVKAACIRAAADAAKKRQKRMACEAFRCLCAVAVVAGLYLAEAAGLIAPVLTGPVYAVALVSIGWHLSNLNRMRGRK